MPHQSTSVWLRALRLLRFALHLLRAVAIAGLIFPFSGRPARRRHIQQWSAQLLRILAVRLHVNGVVPTTAVAALIVANHVSWLDIIAINAACPVRFVAKAEIRRWPLVGWLCARGDTLFIDRSRLQHTREVNQVVAVAMRAGDAFAVFPEGFITHGDRLRPFHASLLQPALDCAVAVHPAALRYSRIDGSLCLEADYEGEKTLVEALFQLLTQPRVDLQLQFLSPLASAGMHRRELADAAARDIANALGLAVPNKRAGSARDPTA